MPATGPDASSLEQVARALLAGEVAVFPTETVYGIGAGAFATQAIRRIYELKGRHGRKPLAILVASLDAARPLVETIPPEALRLAEAFCPGPMTFVLAASPLGRLVTGGLATIGVRVPAHPIALELITRVGLPLATTSVNRSGGKPATSHQQALEIFKADVEWFLDGGECALKQPSSVVDFSHYPFTVIGDGALPKKKIEHLLSSIQLPGCNYNF